MAVNGDNMTREIIIGDIHGCFHSLLDLINILNINHQEDTLIFLGDYIDRGKYSYEVIEYLKRLQKDMHCVCLLGNHEQMMLDAIDSNDKSLWKQNGGTKTIKSYHRHNKKLKVHYNWLFNLPVFYETKKRIYCHAGLPKTKLIDNTKDDMIWNVDWIFDKKEPNEKMVIFGHFSNDKPFKTQNGNIGIDTSCCRGNKLTAMIIDEDDNYSFMQVDKNEKD